jgi:hypothetical protein
MRKTQYEQIFSALTPIADILGGRAVHGNEGGRFPFHSQHYANSGSSAFRFLGLNALSITRLLSRNRSANRTNRLSLGDRDSNRQRAATSKCGLA